MTGRRWYLAIDLGTQGPKVAAIAHGGTPLADSFIPATTTRGADGAATQDPDEWWEALCRQTRSVCASVGERRPAAIGLTGQYGSTVPVDAAGRAVGPCLLWADTRAAGRVAHVGSHLRRALWERLASGAPDEDGSDPLGHEHTLRELYPEAWTRTRFLLEPVDYLGARLTGRIAATPASMIASFLIRPDRATSQPRYSRTLVRLSRRDPARLPPLRPTGSVLGPVTPAAASDLGIAEGTPVVAGISDLHSAYLGSGALGAAHLVVSSTTWLGLALNKPRSASRRGLNTVPGVAPAKLLIEDCQSNGGLAMDWVIRTIWRDGPSDEESIYERFAAAALRSPSGAYGLRFLPWLNGERTPMGNPDLRGALVGVSTTTTSDDIARATLEGIAANACLLIESVSELVGAPITQLRLMGRCVELDALCQILADVGGLACHRVRDPRLANLRGAAIFAAHALDALAPGEVESWTPVGRSFFPATGQAGRV